MKSIIKYIVAAGLTISLPAVANELDGSFPDLRNYGVVIDHIVNPNGLYFDFEMDTDGDNLIDVIYRYKVRSKFGEARWILEKPVGLWLDDDGNGVFDRHEYRQLGDATEHDETN